MKTRRKHPRRLPALLEQLRQERLRLATALIDSPEDHDRLLRLRAAVEATRELIRHHQKKEQRP